VLISFHHIRKPLTLCAGQRQQFQKSAVLASQKLLDRPRVGAQKPGGFRNNRPAGKQWGRKSLSAALRQAASSRICGCIGAFQNWIQLGRRDQPRGRVRFSLHAKPSRLRSSHRTLEHRFGRRRRSQGRLDAGLAVDEVRFYLWAGCGFGFWSLRIKISPTGEAAEPGPSGLIEPG